MDQPKGGQTVSRRSKEELLELLSEYNKSQPMTVKAFCRLHQISEASFYTARKRYKPAKISKKQSFRFISIDRPAFNSTAATLFAEVNGIRLYQVVPADYLKSLIL
jgi:hypothetical protein